jgi:MFS family permease
MAMWMSIGFAFFGKNVFNMVPLTCGVWLFAKYSKGSFSSYYLSALLVATLCPTISEIAFLGMFNRPVEIIAGILLGFLVGFIFPAVSADSVKIHSAFNLYNMGFAGGLIATMLATLFKSLGIDIVPAAYWSHGNNTFFAGLLYSLSLVMLATGLLTSLTKETPRITAKKNLEGYRNIHKQPGRLMPDYYEMFENSIYINMAVLCSFATTVVLVLGAELNGPAIAGILTMTGFGSLGKHLRNVAPVVIGAVMSAFINKWDPAAPVNIVAILFSSGLAPISGMFGPIWGVIAGFLHVNIATHIGDLNGGLNLYNNGFAAAFVAMFLLPIITIFKKDTYFKKDKYK